MKTDRNAVEGDGKELHGISHASKMDHFKRVEVLYQRTIVGFELIKGFKGIWTHGQELTNGLFPEGFHLIFCAELKD